MHDLATGQSQQVAQHDAPIKVVKWVETPQGGILATGSWDKTIKVWDLATGHIKIDAAEATMSIVGETINIVHRSTVV